jgi:predicted Zn-dependent protease
VRDFAVETVDLAVTRGVAYADVRVVRQREEKLRVKNGGLEAWSDEESVGFGVRVLVGGHWGFASAAWLDRAEAERAVSRAVALARSAERRFVFLREKRIRRTGRRPCRRTPSRCPERRSSDFSSRPRTPSGRPA